MDYFITVPTDVIKIEDGDMAVGSMGSEGDVFDNLQVILSYCLCVYVSIACGPKLLGSSEVKTEKLWEYVCNISIIIFILYVRSGKQFGLMLSDCTYCA